MKKFVSILFTLCILFSLSACTSDNQPKKEVKSEAGEDSNTSQSKEEVFGLNETATFENFKITALNMEESSGQMFSEPEEGNIFVGVNFEIENISEETQNMSSLLLFDAYADDVKCSYSLSANIVFGDGTLDGEISPGKKLVGWYAVEVPADWQALELEVKANWLSSNKAKFVFTK